jgi:hypothetical protein
MVGCGGVGNLVWRGGGERVWGLRMIGGAVKEREGDNVTVDGKDFGEEVGGVNKAGKEDKTEADPLLQPFESH